MAPATMKVIATSSRTLEERLNFRNKIEELQADMKTAANNVDDQFPLIHFFAPGIYMRQIFLPAGTLVCGKIHKTCHGNIIAKGLVEVCTEFEDWTLYDAREYPLHFISGIGTKRLIKVFEPTYWTTVHHTNKTTVEEVEAEIFEDFYEDFLSKVPELRLISGG